MEAKQLPNILSVSRIALSALLPFVSGQPLLFLMIYLVAGITDFADGYIARKRGWTSRVGALLDSVADTVFFLIILLVIWINFRTVITDNLLWLALILSLKAVSILIGLLRFGKFIAIHTLANKTMGILLFITIPLIALTLPPVVIKVICMLGLIPAAEEMLLLLLCKEPDPNRKSILS